jgi:plastocyanin
MFKTQRSVRIIAPITLASALIVGVIAFLIAHGIPMTSHTVSSAQAAKVSATAVVKILHAQEVFDPFIQTVQVGSTVIWQNQDSVAHTLTTTWDHSGFLNPEPFSLVVSANASAHFTFTTVGIYDYFDTGAATWDKTTHRVAANKGVPNFPLAMEGIIWVQGPMSSVSSTAAQVIPNGADDFMTDFLAIAQGGSVSWHNGDTDTHFVALVPQWSAPINPVNIGVITIAGTTTVQGGGTQVMIFNKPGLYYYYCPSHAAINTQWRRAQAHTDASIYPMPMEGFILVVGK